MTRADRVAELIKQEVSDIISRKLNDPRIGFASITSVDLGADLKNARIYVSVYGEQKQKNDTMAALLSATKFIRRELGQRMQMRDVPDLIFKPDDSIERGAKVFEILNRLEQEKKSKDQESKKNMKDVISAIRKAKSVIIFTHTDPDGDAIGSMLAVFLALKGMGKKAVMYSKDPVPDIYQFLPESGRIKDSLGKDKFDLAIAVDCGGKNRIDNDFDLRVDR